MVVGDHLGDTHRQLLGARQVQELVRAMRPHAGPARRSRGTEFLKAPPSMPMNGMLPPVPRYIASRPNVARDASRIEASSQSATGGASQPGCDEPTSNRTRTP